MDSLTQLTLGAACGEAILGRKIGNRAMVWGAFGGLLPDLDIVAYLFTDEMTALAFHRGFMHSILFSILAAFGLSWWTERMYKTGFYKRRGYKAVVMGLSLLALGGIIFGINYLAWGSIPTLAISLLVFAWCARWFWKNYWTADLQEVTATRRQWWWLFWLSIFTHPVLDSFTAFGTQLFQPFSNYRVAFNNISIVDPFYTVPMILCLLIAGFVKREKKARRALSWIGLGVSSLYMIYTLTNKLRADQIWQASLDAQGIQVNRCLMAPSIFQNFLWQGIAEGDTAFYQGYYSFLDEEPRVCKISVIPKNHHLITQWENERTIRILRWFSGDYFNVIQRADGKLQFNNLRYGSRKDGMEKETDYIFRFVLEEKNGKLEAHQTREGQDVTSAAFKELFDRVKGISCE